MIGRDPRGQEGVKKALPESRHGRGAFTTVIEGRHCANGLAAVWEG